MAMSRVCLLLAALALLTGPVWAQVPLEFYPSSSGDNSTFRSGANWYRYTTEEPLNAYPPTALDGHFNDATFPYPNNENMVDGYIRDARTVTLSGGTGKVNDMRIGSDAYLDTNGSWIPKGPSTLIVRDGGALTTAEGLSVGFAYDGTFKMEAGGFLNCGIDAGRTNLGLRSDTAQSPTSTGAYIITGGTYLGGNKTELGRGRGGVGILEMSGGYSEGIYFHVGEATNATAADIAGKGIITITGGTFAPRRLDLGSGDFYTMFSWVEEDPSGYNPYATGTLNLMGGTLVWNWEADRGEGSADDNGIRITKGTLHLGKNFHCDSIANPFTFGQQGANPYDRSKLWLWSGGSFVVDMKNASEFGYLSVAQNIKLSGSFSVNVDPAASWAVGDKFCVLRSRNGTALADAAFLASYNSLTDRYFNIAIEAVGAGGNGLVLTAVKAAGAQPHPGDANNDGAVNVG
ncbi:MAG: hypothetical protein NTW26_07060, partial [bacterium]|nr:hypothetical protein [bacterium]